MFGELYRFLLGFGTNQCFVYRYNLFLTLKKITFKTQKKREKKISLKMPGVITVSDFVRETNEDIKSPTTSSFVHRIPQCKDTVTKLEEVRYYYFEFIFKV